MKKVYVSLLSFAWLFFAKVSQAADGDIKLGNPLRGGDPAPVGLPVVVGNIVKGLLGVIGIISLVYFVIGGMYYLTSAGNPEKVKKGTSTLIWAVIGLVVAFGSYAILSFVVQTLGSAGT